MFGHRLQHAGEIALDLDLDAWVFLGKFLDQRLSDQIDVVVRHAGAHMAHERIGMRQGQRLVLQSEDTAGVTDPAFYPSR